MSQRLIDRVRAKFPQYADVPDDRLTLAIGEKYPQYLEQDGNFARTFDAYRQMRLNDADTAARTSLAGHVGAAVESGMENFVGAAQAVDRELIAPLTGGTVDQWASAVPEAASLMLRQPVREAGKVFSAAGRLLAEDVANVTRLTGLDPAGPVARGLRDVGETAPVLAASMGLQRLGVNPAVAFGAPPAVQTYGETGDVAATLKAGATGALIPAVAQAGKLGGAALNRALIERNLLSPAANATQKAVEVLGSQGAVQVFMEGLRLPEYAALDPEARREAIYRNLVANTAFLAMDLPTFKRSVPSETLLRMTPAERVAYGLRDAASNPELVDALQRTADELARQATLPDAAQVEGEGPLFRREAPLGEVPGPRQNTQAAPDSASTVAQRFPGPAADAPGRPLDPFPTDQALGETMPAEGETAMDRMLRDRRQNKFREKAEAIRARRDAWINQTLDQAGERGSLEYVSTERPDRTLIVSPVPGQPGRWRTTQFDANVPIGHYEFDSREQAIRAVGGEHHTKQIAGPSYFGTGEYVLKRSKERYNIAADSRPLDPFPTDQGAVETVAPEGFSPVDQAVAFGRRTVRPLDPFPTDQGVGETVAPDAEWNVVGMGQMKRPVVKGGDEGILQPPAGADRGAVEIRPNDAGRLPEGPGEARPAAVDAGGVADASGGADRGYYKEPSGKTVILMPKAEYDALDARLKDRIRSYFNWSPTRKAFISKASKDDYWPRQVIREAGLEEIEAREAPVKRADEAPKPEAPKVDMNWTPPKTDAVGLERDRAEVAAADAEVRRLTDEYARIDRLRREVEAKVIGTRGWSKGRIKSNARPAEVEVWKQHQQTLARLDGATEAIRKRSLAARQRVHAADLDAIAANPELPDWRRLGARLGAFGYRGEPIPDGLVESLNRAVAHEIHRHVPDVLPDEIGKFSTRLSDAALRTDEPPDFAKQLPELVQEWRRMKLVEGLRSVGAWGAQREAVKRAIGGTLDERVPGWDYSDKPGRGRQPITADELTALPEQAKAAIEQGLAQEQADADARATAAAEANLREQQELATAQKMMADAAEEMRKAGTKRSAKDIKDELIRRVTQAYQEAPGPGDLGTHPRFRVIAVPGDGIFRVGNTKEQLGDLLKRARSLETSTGLPSQPGPAKGKVVPKLGTGEDQGKIQKALADFASSDETRANLNQVFSDGRRLLAGDGKTLIEVPGEYKVADNKEHPFPVAAADGIFAKARANRMTSATLRTDDLFRLGTLVERMEFKDDPYVDIYTDVQGRTLYGEVKDASGDFAAYGKPVMEVYLGRLNVKSLVEVVRFARSMGDETLKVDRADWVEQQRRINDKGIPELVDVNQRVMLLAGEKWRGATTRFNVEARPTVAEIPADKVGETNPGKSSGVAGSPRQPQGQFGLPAIPAGTATAVPSKRMVVTMERLVPGFTTVANIERRLSAIVDVARGIADASPIRSNRLSRRFAGVYTTPSRVVRMWDRLNLPTTAHEVAHALADAIFGTAASRGLRGIPPSVGRELVRLGRNLYGNTRPNAGYAAEGWAELVADYLTTDDIARRAPEATRWLENTVLPAFPEVAQAMREARAEIDVWRGMGARERMRAQTAPHDSKLARLRTELGRYVGREGLVEQFAPFEALSRRFRQVAGRDLAADEDPFLIASARRGQAGSILAYMADEGMIDPSGNRTGGRSLREALAPVTRGLRPDQVLARNQRAADFWSYLWARRAIERWGLDRNPGISLADAQYLRQTLETPDFQLAASRYYQWWDGVLDYLSASSPANRELVARIRAGSKDYVPLARMLDPNQTRPGEEARLSNALRRMRGSSLPVRMLDVQTLLTAESLIARAHRDQVMEAVFRLANQPGMGAMIEEVPRSQVQEVVNIERLRAQLEGMGVDTTGIPADTLLEYYTGADAPGGSDPIVARRVNGEVRWYYVRPDLYAALEGIQPARLPLVADLLLGVPARLFRLGTTGLRPAFSLFTNPVRDIQTFLMQSTAGVNPLRRVAQYFGALGDIVRSGMPGADATPYRDLFDRLGIMSGQPLGGDIGYARREARGLFHGRVFKRVTAPVETLRELLSFSEATPRIAELRLRAQELGWAPGQPLTPAQAIQLTLAAKRVTTDFSAGGSYARLWSQAVPFLNASIQGTRGFLRAMRERRRAATLYGVSMFTLPALWTWWHNKDEEWYRALPWRERYLYWNVPDENGQVYQIPRPPEWNNAFAVIPEALFDAAYRDNPDAVKAAFGHIFATTNPFDLPVLARIAWEQARNRVDFFDRPIVPRAQVDLRPGEQVGPYTSWLATSLGKAFPETISPRRVDHLLRGVGGGTASDTLSAIEQMAGLKAGALRSEPSETPVVGRALRRGGQFSAVNRQLADLYDLHYYWQARARNKELAPELAAYARYVDDQIQMVKFGQRVAEQTEDLKARQSLYRDLTRQAESMLADAKRLKRLPAQQ